MSVNHVFEDTSPGPIPSADASDPGLFPISDAEVVAEVLGLCRTRLPAAELRARGRRYDAQFTPLRGGEQLGFCVFSPSAGPWKGGRCELVFTIDGACFELRGIAAAVGPGTYRLGQMALHARSPRGGARWPIRGKEVTLRWSEPDASRVAVHSARVIDISSGGVGVAIADQPVPRSTFAAAVVLDGSIIPCLGEPRHAQRSAEGSRFGLRIHTGQGRLAFVDEYMRHAFPRFTLRGGLPEEKVVELFQRSGYLDLRSGEGPSRAWLAIRDRGAITRDVVYRTADGQALGHVSTTRAYPKAWVAHQLATLRDHPETAECRLALYRHMAAYPYLMDGESGHMLAYFDRSKRWHNLMFDRFVRWMNDDRLVTIANLDRFERSTPPPQPASIPGVTVGHPADEDLVPAAAIIRAQLPALLSQALDIHPERLAAPQLHPHYGGSSLERGRRALVLKVDGRLAGVALCETTTRSLSLFNIFNMAQLFFVTGPSAPSPAAQGQLLSQVRRHYAERNDPNPLIVAPANSLSLAAEDGLALAETMGCIVFAGRSLGYYDSYLSYQFARWREPAPDQTHQPKGA